MRDRLAELLTLLTRELKAQQRWGNQSPDAEALLSSQPFAVDTLAFDEWLQWVFLPKLQALLANQMPLPRECAVRPMAEEVYGPDDPAGQRLIALLGEIDALLTTGNHHLN